MSLAWPNHVHHVAATTWFRGRVGQPWATTPLTELGFVRVSSSKAAIPGAVTPSEAIDLLGRLSKVAGHHLLADDVGGVLGAYVETGRILSHLHLTDAHLLAVARRHGASLATFDRGIAALAGDKDIVTIPFN